MIESAKNKKLFFEEVKERVGDTILVSSFRPATESDIKTAEEKHILGKCDHLVFYDEPSFLYDIRKCVMCGHISLI